MNEGVSGFAEPYRLGYKFSGWYSDGEYKNKISRIEQGNLGYMVLYAKWKANKYKIAFNGNGADKGTMKTLTNREYGKLYELPSNRFSKKGCAFAGWNTMSDGSGVHYPNLAGVVNLTETDGDTVTLYAQWNENAYSITYHIKGGMNHPENPDYYDERSGTFILKEPTRVGYQFDGWYKSSKFTYKNKLDIIVGGSKGNKHFYAKWKPYKYSINFDGNGATGGYMSAKTNMSCGKKYTIPKNKFTKKGYTFAGWNTEKDGSGIFCKNKGSINNLTSEDGTNITFYAQWKLTKYKITYRGKGGTVPSYATKTYTILSEPVSLSVPYRSGYRFVGWYTNKKYKASSEISVIVPDKAKNYTIYAKWKKIY